MGPLSKSTRRRCFIVRVCQSRLQKSTSRITILRIFCVPRELIRAYHIEPCVSRDTEHNLFGPNRCASNAAGFCPHTQGVIFNWPLTCYKARKMSSKEWDSNQLFHDSSSNRTSCKNCASPTLSCSVTHRLGDSNLATRAIIAKRN